MSEQPSLIDRGFRQGGIVRCAAIAEFPDFKQALEQGRAIPSKRNSPIEEHHFLLVLSQDCDIANSDEKYIEFATVKPVALRKASDATQRARNLRRLQLMVGEACWEIESSLISVVPKQVLLDAPGIGVEQALDEVSQEILIQWRVNRYTREPLPHPFNVAFILEYLHNPKTGLHDFFTENRERIWDVFAFVDPIEDEDSQEYKVSLTMVLRVGCSEADVVELAAELRPHIEELNRIDNRLCMLQATGEEGSHPALTNLELVCLPVDFSFEDAQCFRRLTLDFLCWD